jgi:hypothetical protein
MTRHQIDTLREQYVMQRDNDTEGGLDRDGFIRADAEAWEMYPYPEDAPREPRGTHTPATLDDVFAEGDPNDSFEPWWL